MTSVSASLTKTQVSSGLFATIVSKWKIASWNSPISPNITASKYVACQLSGAISKALLKTFKAASKRPRAKYPSPNPIQESISAESIRKAFWNNSIALLSSCRSRDEHPNIL
ncbi:hypothetical protein OGAPHI_003471 [Ogataea philodendri]|uniref:Uncharacterized protein n=1 Tax=Ogataea philodendri TaxID=1378263 RepID=A0A9P8P7J1_9ASCO|nr:uncharacterized protein OGAPHI_003471 [Ogataea philodendri]KAH3666475.1 hypothetical protein OGAPHI_003471 [Ogataea philodendri]